MSRPVYLLTAIASLFLFLGLGPAPKKPALTGKEAIARLKKGNQRFAQAQLTHPNLDEARRTKVATGQRPFAVIVGCSDSRVPPELIFDTGLGDLFVIRLAGNIITGAALGSIEYAVEHLHSPLVVVLGHERCGAVTAALAGGKPGGNVATLVDAIRPAVVETRERSGDRLDLTVRANARRGAEQIRSSQPLLRKAIAEGRLTVVSARYDLDDGVVTFLK